MSALFLHSSMPFVSSASSAFLLEFSKFLLYEFVCIYSLMPSHLLPNDFNYCYCIIKIFPAQTSFLNSRSLLLTYLGHQSAHLKLLMARTQFYFFLKSSVCFPFLLPLPGQWRCLPHCLTQEPRSHCRFIPPGPYALHLVKHQGLFILSFNFSHFFVLPKTLLEIRLSLSFT